MMPGTSSSILLPVLSSIFVFCVCGGRTNLDAGDNGELATSFTSPAGIGDPPAGWKTITLSVEGKSDGRRVEIGDSVDEVEAIAEVTRSCREAGMSEDQTDIVLIKWELSEIWDNRQRRPLLSNLEQHQAIGGPWEQEETFDATEFLVPTQRSSSSLSGDSLVGVCGRRDDYDQPLTQVDVWEVASKTAPRIFCGIFTHQHNHSTRVKAIRETWASHCDGFVAFSDIADPELHTYEIKHEGPEEYGNMWQKSRAIWKYINFHYKDDYDWFLLGGDDLFVIVHNLRKYLLSDEIQLAAGGAMNGGANPMYLGRRLRPFGEEDWIFNSGGAAYVLNQASVGLLGSSLEDKVCQPIRKTAREDVMVAVCLKKNGVHAFDTRDALGRERFHPFTPAIHFGNIMPAWFVESAIDLKVGRECCSRDSVSFHYVDDQLMRQLYQEMFSCRRNA